MQDLDKHIHESDAQSNNDKQEVADVTIEKILPNLEMNEIQMQEQIVAVHDSDVMSDDDICDVDEIIEKYRNKGVKDLIHVDSFINFIRQIFIIFFGHLGTKFLCSFRIGCVQISLLRLTIKFFF